MHHPLSIADWQQIRKLAASPEFLVSQGYIPYPMGVSNFIHDICPQPIKDAWKIRQLDHIAVLNLLCEYSEYTACMEVKSAVRHIRDTGICAKILSDCELNLDTQVYALSPSAIADKYLTITMP